MSQKHDPDFDRGTIRYLASELEIPARLALAGGAEAAAAMAELKKAHIAAIPGLQGFLNAFAANWSPNGALTKRGGYDFNTVTNRHVNGRDLWSGRLSVSFQPTRLNCSLPR